jgi:hypothetical protein
MASPLEGAIRTSRLVGVAGDLADNMRKDCLTYINDSPRAQQVDTVTIDTATDTETYSVLVDGVELEVVAASAVVADIALLIANAVNASQLVNSNVVAEAAGAVVTLTARIGGEGFTLAEGQNAAKMTAASVTANATANPVGFGLAVIYGGLSSGSNKLAKLINSTDVTNTATADAQIVGVTLRDVTQEIPLDSDTAVYEANQPMSVARDARLFVAIEADLTDLTTPVYVRTVADGALTNVGGFAPGAGTGLVAWTNARWVRQAGSGLAIIAVNVR